MAFDFERCLAEARTRLASGAGTEDMLQFFRQSGGNILQSIRLLSRLNNIDLGESKRVVHFSETWNDFRGGSEQLHEEAERVAIELTQSQKLK